MDLRTAPDWLLRYIAPMMCGTAERAELCRRERERQARLIIIFYALLAAE